jgi:Bacterial SH3 domain
MRNRLFLTLWLVGAVLYAGSTIFLARAVLGGGSTVAADKSKSNLVAAAADAQCKKDSVASGPALAPSAAKPAAPETAKSDSAHPTTGAEQRSADNDQPSGDQQDPDASSPDGAPPPDGYEQQEARGPDAGDGPAERDEWARVVAGTADMRSEPSMQAQLIYALPAGWEVRVISRRPGWVQVQDANSGAAGWVEATALAPSGGRNGPGGPGGRPGYEDAYAEEGYPYPPPPWRRPGAPFGEFLRRALGGW